MFGLRRNCGGKKQNFSCEFRIWGGVCMVENVILRYGILKLVWYLLVHETILVNYQISI